MSRWIRAFVYGGLIAALGCLVANEYQNFTKVCPTNTIKVRGYDYAAVCVTGSFARDVM